MNEFASNDKEENEGNESEAPDVEKKSEAPITADQLFNHDSPIPRAIM